MVGTAGCLTLSLFTALENPVQSAAQEKPQARNHKELRYKLVDLGSFGGPTNYMSTIARGRRLQ